MKRTFINYGFTLLEILIVVMVIGIASTLVVLKVGNSYLSANRPDIFAKEMYSLIELARKQAIFKMQVIGLTIAPDQYTFSQLITHKKTTTWEPLSKKDSFWAHRAIPQKIIVTYEAQAKTLTQETSFTPKIIIMPNGEVTPFSINVRAQGASNSYVISATGSGHVHLNEKE